MWLAASGLHADVPTDMLRDGRAQALSEHATAHSMLAQRAEARRRAAAVAAAAAWRTGTQGAARFARAIAPAAEPEAEAGTLGAVEIEACCRELVAEYARQHARGVGQTVLLIDREGGAHGPVPWLAATAVSVMLRAMLEDVEEDGAEVPQGPKLCPMVALEKQLLNQFGDLV